MFTWLSSSKSSRVYLDNAGATRISEASRRALDTAFVLYGNPSAIHHEGDMASRLLDKARILCANALNAHAYEIFFVGSGTESCNMAVLGTYNTWKKNNTDEKVNCRYFLYNLINICLRKGQGPMVF